MVSRAENSKGPHDMILSRYAGVNKICIAILAIRLWDFIANRCSKHIADHMSVVCLCVFLCGNNVGGMR